MAGMRFKLDLHDIYNRGGDIDRALRAIINEAVATKAPLVEIIPGKGSGALKSMCCASWSRKRSSLSTTGWRRTRITSAGSSCTSAGNDRRRRHARQRPPRLIWLSSREPYPETERADTRLR
jgi:hypothetical protein